MCEFDTEVKIEKYYHHGEEQLGFYVKGHTGKLDPAPIGGIRDPLPGTQEPGSIRGT